MKSTIVALLFAVFFSTAYSQEKIVWSGKYNEASHVVILTAKLAEGWHLYSQATDEFSGPVATKFELVENDLLHATDEFKEPDPIVAYDPNFEAEVKFFEHQVDFEHHVDAKKNTEAEYIITYMICNDEMCLPPVDKKIVVAIKK